MREEFENLWREGVRPAIVLGGQTGIRASTFDGVIEIVYQVADNLQVLGLQIVAFRGILPEVEELNRPDVLDRAATTGVQSGLVCPRATCAIMYYAIMYQTVTYNSGHGVHG